MMGAPICVIYFAFERGHQIALKNTFVVKRKSNVTWFIRVPYPSHILYDSYSTQEWIFKNFIFLCLTIINFSTAKVTHNVLQPQWIYNGFSALVCRN